MRLAVFDRRRAGVLLPLSALDAPLGRGGRAFIDWLVSAGFSVWQILPAGPVGADRSPYWVRSDQAGEPNLLDGAELPGADTADEAEFLAAAAGWLPDYALFEALAAAHQGAPFWQWPTGLRDREARELGDARRALAGEIRRSERAQFAFHLQWRRLRDYARARGVRLYGDLPFYVAPSSAETWVHRELFQLRANGAPAAVGGVPPDYFTEHGQLWGNPAYDWPAHERSAFAWWRGRIGAQLARLDLLRVDHFRGLSACWVVDAAAADARGGSWQEAPGKALLGALRSSLGELPFVAEDLGVITADVRALQESFTLPGMRVLQFAFDGDPANLHLPYLHRRDCVVYTGTHDNDTALGWYRSLDRDTAQRAELYLQAAPGNFPQALVRAALGSVAQLAVVPLQDLLGLGSEARINRPGTASGNWTWRLPAGSLTEELAHACARLNRTFGRA
ncbi:MAG: 4-alpha-glucanotransferase [Gammaproteobacteria bacterium]|nr:4-alpha-glucanotransferase [Gammaproteobacteria bacterium]